MRAVQKLKASIIKKKRDLLNTHTHIHTYKLACKQKGKRCVSFIFFFNGINNQLNLLQSKCYILPYLIAHIHTQTRIHVHNSTVVVW